MTDVGAIAQVPGAGPTAVVELGSGQAYDVAQVEDAIVVRWLLAEYRARLNVISELCDQTLRDQLARDGSAKLHRGEYEVTEGTGRVTWADLPGMRDQLAAAGISEQRLEELFTLALNGREAVMALGMLERRNEDIAEIVNAHRARGRGSLKVTRREAYA